MRLNEMRHDRYFDLWPEATRIVKNGTNGMYLKYYPFVPFKGCAVGTARNYSKEWITTPDRSFGSNHVVLGGMMLPVSAILINCCIETG